MNHVDLQLLVIDAIKDVHRYDLGTQSILLARNLWPVLADVWDEGFKRCAKSIGSANEPTNPYRTEVSS